jgi:hypothetical protein
MHDGRMPLNAVFHAEATLLLRAAKAQGGTLSGQSFEAYVDRSMCAHAREVFPLIGTELGNPTVTFIGPLGERHTMRDGAWVKQVSNAIKRAYFDSRPREGWPTPEELEGYFLAPPERRWFSSGGNDSASLIAEGLFGTQHCPAQKGRCDAHLYMWGNPKLGVLLLYRAWGRDYSRTFSSKGDLFRLDRKVRTLHDDPMPIGLYIPFENAWKAVKEYIVTDGELPKSIEWIANQDLPADTFPDP